MHISGKNKWKRILTVMYPTQLTYELCWYLLRSKDRWILIVGNRRDRTGVWRQNTSKETGCCAWTIVRLTRNDNSKLYIRKTLSVILRFLFPYYLSIRSSVEKKKNLYPRAMLYACTSFLICNIIRGFKGLQKSNILIIYILKKRNIFKKYIHVDTCQVI